jgi:hypothetical protein
MQHSGSAHASVWMYSMSIGKRSVRHMSYRFSLLSTPLTATSATSMRESRQHCALGERAHRTNRSHFSSRELFGSKAIIAASASSNSSDRPVRAGSRSGRHCEALSAAIFGGGGVA